MNHFLYRKIFLVFLVSVIAFPVFAANHNVSNAQELKNEIEKISEQIRTATLTTNISTTVTNINDSSLLGTMTFGQLTIDGKGLKQLTLNGTGREASVGNAGSVYGVTIENDGILTFENIKIMGTLIGGSITRTTTLSNSSAKGGDVYLAKINDGTLDVKNSTISMITIGRADISINNCGRGITIENKSFCEVMGGDSYFVSVDTGDISITSSTIDNISILGGSITINAVSEFAIWFKSSSNVVRGGDGYFVRVSSKNININNSLISDVTIYGGEIYARAPNGGAGNNACAAISSYWGFDNPPHHNTVRGGDAYFFKIGDDDGAVDITSSTIKGATIIGGGIDTMLTAGSNWWFSGLSMQGAGDISRAGNGYFAKISTGTIKITSTKIKDVIISGGFIDSFSNRLGLYNGTTNVVGVGYFIQADSATINITGSTISNLEISGGTLGTNNIYEASAIGGKGYFVKASTGIVNVIDSKITDVNITGGTLSTNYKTYGSGDVKAGDAYGFSVDSRTLSIQNSTVSMNVTGGLFSNISMQHQWSYGNEIIGGGDGYFVQFLTGTIDITKSVMDITVEGGNLSTTGVKAYSITKGGDAYGFFLDKGILSIQDSKMNLSAMAGYASLFSYNRVENGTAYGMYIGATSTTTIKNSSATIITGITPGGSGKGGNSYGIYTCAETILNIEKSTMSITGNNGIYALTDSSMKVENSSVTILATAIGIYSGETGKINIDQSTMSIIGNNGIYALENSQIGISNSSVSIDAMDYSIYSKSDVKISNSYLSLVNGRRGRNQAKTIEAQNTELAIDIYIDGSGNLTADYFNMLDTTEGSVKGGINLHLSTETASQIANIAEGRHEVILFRNINNQAQPVIGLSEPFTILSGKSFNDSNGTTFNFKTDIDRSAVYYDTTIFNLRVAVETKGIFDYEIPPDDPSVKYEYVDLDIKEYNILGKGIIKTSFTVIGAGKTVYGYTQKEGVEGTHKAGISLKNNEALTIQDSTWTGFETNNTVNSAGGAVIGLSNGKTNEGGTITITSSMFTDNKAKVGNGGVINAEKGLIDISLSEFNNNEANTANGSNAGAIYVKDIKMNIEHSTFTNNKAKQTGGAIYIGGASSVTITETLFENNQNANDSQGGGAIAIKQGIKGTGKEADIKITSSKFNNNGTLDNSIFGGGAIIISHDTGVDGSNFGKVKISSVVFSGNKANTGGAIRTEGFNVEIENVLFENNIAKNSNSSNDGSGGAILIDKNGVSITSATFKGNKANRGSEYNDIFILSDQNNKGKVTFNDYIYMDGGIYAKANPDIVIKDSDFNLMEGARIEGDSANVEVTNSSIKINSGLGAYSQIKADANPRVTNATALSLHHTFYLADDGTKNDLTVNGFYKGIDFSKITNAQNISTITVTNNVIGIFNDIDEAPVISGANIYGERNEHGFDINDKRLTIEASTIMMKDNTTAFVANSLEIQTSSVTIMDRQGKDQNDTSKYIQMVESADMTDSRISIIKTWDSSDWQTHKVDLTGVVTDLNFIQDNDLTVSGFYEGINLSRINNTNLQNFDDGVSTVTVKNNNYGITNEGNYTLRNKVVRALDNVTAGILNRGNNLTIQSNVTIYGNGQDKDYKVEPIYGILSDRTDIGTNLTINQSTITARIVAADSKYYSDGDAYGMSFSSGTVSILNSSININAVAVGEKFSNSKAYGIYMDKNNNLEMEESRVTAIATTNGYGVYIGEGSTLTVAASTLTATGYNSSNYPIDIQADNAYGIVISEDGKLVLDSTKGEVNLWINYDGVEHGPTWGWVYGTAHIQNWSDTVVELLGNYDYAEHSYTDIYINGERLVWRKRGGYGIESSTVIYSEEGADIRAIQDYDVIKDEQNFLAKSIITNENTKGGIYDADINIEGKEGLTIISNNNGTSHAENEENAGTGAGITFIGGNTIKADSIESEGNRSSGILVKGTNNVLECASISLVNNGATATETDKAKGFAKRGVVLAENSSIQIIGTVTAINNEIGVLLQNGSLLNASAIQTDNEAHKDNILGIKAEQANLKVSSVTTRYNKYGIWATGEGAKVEVGDGQSEAYLMAQNNDYGIYLTDKSTMTITGAEQVKIYGSYYDGIYADNSLLEIRQSTVNIAETGNTAPGKAMYATNGSSITITDSRVYINGEQRNMNEGIKAEEINDGHVNITDSWIYVDKVSSVGIVGASIVDSRVEIKNDLTKNAEAIGAVGIKKEGLYYIKLEGNDIGIKGTSVRDSNDKEILTLVNGGDVIAKGNNIAIDGREGEVLLERMKLSIEGKDIQTSTGVIGNKVTINNGINIKVKNNYVGIQDATLKNLGEDTVEISSNIIGIKGTTIDKGYMTIKENVVGIEGSSIVGSDMVIKGNTVGIKGETDIIGTDIDIKGNVTGVELNNNKIQFIGTAKEYVPVYYKNEEGNVCYEDENGEEVIAVGGKPGCVVYKNKTEDIYVSLINGKFVVYDKDSKTTTEIAESGDENYEKMKWLTDNYVGRLNIENNSEVGIKALSGSTIMVTNMDVVSKNNDMIWMSGGSKLEVKGSTMVIVGIKNEAAIKVLDWTYNVINFIDSRVELLDENKGLIKLEDYMGTADITVDNSRVEGKIFGAVAGVRNVTLKNRGAIAKAGGSLISKLTTDGSGMIVLNISDDNVDMIGIGKEEGTIRIKEIRYEVSKPNKILLNIDGDGVFTDSKRVVTSTVNVTVELSSTGVSSVSMLELNGYNYGLIGGGKEWSLENKGKSNTAKMVSNIPSVTNAIVVAGQNSLTRRLGDIRRTPKDKLNGVWTRVYGRNDKFTKEIETNMEMTGAEGGYDRQVLTDKKDRYYIGAMVGYQNINKIESKQETGKKYNGEGTAPSAGVYGTWIAENGMFIDITVRNFWINLDMNNDDKNYKPYRNQVAVSGEIGKSFNVYSGNNSTVVIEPKTEWVYSYAGQTGNSQLEYGQTKSIKGKLGFMIGFNKQTEKGLNFQPYVEAGYSYEFDNKTKVKMGISEWENDLSGGYGDVGLGLNAYLGKGFSGYSLVSYEKGSDQENFVYNVGIRYGF